MSETVHVCVRMRPFNGREKDANASLCLEMAPDGRSTTITSPEGKKNTFTFDYSFNSHHPENPIASQQTVYDAIGKSYVLEGAWKGINVTLFAYGQTGSGKSFSMTGGPGENRGIIPRTCEEMFSRIQQQQSDTLSFQVEAMFLEIYNEQLRDLFNIKSTKEIKIRENPSIGVYIDGAKRELVRNYQEINTLMEEGTKSRVVAATKMNATSSRSHSVFTIFFKRMEQVGSRTLTKESCISLVDLAGSERQEKTQAEGTRLQEACAINKSLSALGNVIAALADNSVPGAKKKFVPYRDSILTRLLQNSLGGTSQTIMIAALSPANINYGESLSTLQYADRAKRIVNNVKVNENPADKLVNELRAQIEQLKKQLSGQGQGPQGGVPDAASEQWMSEMKAQLDERARLLQDLTMTVAEKERLAEESRKQRQAALQDSGLSTSEILGSMGANTPYLTNLSPDGAMSGALVYLLKDAEVTVGHDKESDIVVGGTGIMEQHCILRTTHEGVLAVPRAENCKVFVNGRLVAVRAPTLLRQADRIILGRNQVFRFMNPALPPAPPMDPEAEWMQVTKELAVAHGRVASVEEYDQSDARANLMMKVDDLIDEANEIAKTLGRPVLFAMDLDEQHNPEIVYVSLDMGISTKWSIATLERRLDTMRAMLRDWQEDGDIDNEPEADPFLDQPADALIGSATFRLDALLRSPAPLSQVLTLTAPHAGARPVQVKADVALFVDGRPVTQADLAQSLVGKNVDARSSFQFVTPPPASMASGVFFSYQMFPEHQDQTERLSSKNSLLGTIFTDMAPFRPFPEIAQEHWAKGGVYTLQVYGHPKMVGRQELVAALEETRGTLDQTKAELAALKERNAAMIALADSQAKKGEDMANRLTAECTRLEAELVQLREARKTGTAPASASAPSGDQAALIQQLREENSALNAELDRHLNKPDAAPAADPKLTARVKKLEDENQKLRTENTRLRALLPKESKACTIL